MDKQKARRMFEEAQKYVGDRADWADIDRKQVWCDLDEQSFLAEYCWVVFACGFKVAVVKKHFDKIEKVFKRFEPEAVARMKPVDPKKLPIRHKQKADGFLKGAKIVHNEGWQQFKARAEREGMNALKELPWIKDITKKHLAKNIGLADVAKDDRHLQRCAKECSARTVDEFAAFLAEEYDMTEHKVDVVLFYWKSRLLDNN